MVEPMVEPYANMIVWSVASSKTNNDVAINLQTFSFQGKEGQLGALFSDIIKVKK